jgi:hypothetical protein
VLAIREPTPVDMSYPGTAAKRAIGVPVGKPGGKNGDR